MSVKTDNLHIRLCPEVKKEAEIILNDLGLTLSGAIDIFLKNTIAQRGIPFEIKQPRGSLYNSYEEFRAYADSRRR